MVWIATGCYYDKEETLYGRTVDCASVNYNYTADIAPLMINYCATSGCHDVSNAGNVKLETYAQTVEHASRINQRVVLDRTMPPGGGLTAEQISVIKCWIENGQPQ